MGSGGVKTQSDRRDEGVEPEEDDEELKTYVFDFHDTKALSHKSGLKVSATDCDPSPVPDRRQI